MNSEKNLEEDFDKYFGTGSQCDGTPDMHNYCLWLLKGRNGKRRTYVLADEVFSGAANRDEYLVKGEEDISLLPNIAKVRASALLAHADRLIPPLDLAKIALPFNFK